MKAAERLKKLRDLSADELKVQENEMKEQMFRLRFQWSMGQTETLKKLRELRRDQARVQTILREMAKGH
ncbi:MAG TPA: 50S ribosomal protein L29 [Terriglobia bacterium]|nr:50S ribosomal protein L29 [Terriglobia bacterium]